MKCKRCRDDDAPEGQEFCDHCLKMQAIDQSLVRRPTGASAQTANRRTGKRGGYKHASESLAVDPEQVEQVRELYRSNGVGDIEHTRDGRPIFTSERQFQAATKARGFRTGRDGYDAMGTQSGRSVVHAREEIERKYADLESLYSQIGLTGSNRLPNNVGELRGQTF